MNIKQLKKFSPILLSLAIALTLLLVVTFGTAEVAYAAESVLPTETSYVCQLTAQDNVYQYSTIKDAIDILTADTDGNYERNIQLLTNRKESIEIPAGLAVTLNLGGNTLTNEDGKHTIVNKGSLTIVSESAGTVDNVSHGKAALVNEGTVILDGGRYTRSAEAGSFEPYSANDTATMCLKTRAQ